MAKKQKSKKPVQQKNLSKASGGGGHTIIPPKIIDPLPHPTYP